MLFSGKMAISPKRLFKVAIQAAIGSNVVACETLSALRKNVIVLTRKKHIP
jgi:translation elongation factor EF-4